MSGCALAQLRPVQIHAYSVRLIAGGAAREVVKVQARQNETQKARNLIAAEQAAQHAKPRHEAIS